MGTYWKGETTVYDLDDCLKAIKQRNDDNEDRITFLMEENKKLKDEHYKDDELQKMKSRLEGMQEEYYRGFPISAKEEEAIEAWKEEHEERKHGLNTFEKRMRAMGCCGGGYTYLFTPTTIGIIGTVKCHCGEEFNFQKL